MQALLETGPLQYTQDYSAKSDTLLSQMMTNSRISWQHNTLIASCHHLGRQATSHQAQTLAVFNRLGEGLKHMGKAADKANVLKQEEIRLKGEEDDKKKDCIKDMHPFISSMILMALAVELDQIGTFCALYRAFYNSKNHCYANIELHH
jgi:hypothetical protein